MSHIQRGPFRDPLIVLLNEKCLFCVVTLCSWVNGVIYWTQCEKKSSFLCFYIQIPSFPLKEQRISKLTSLTSLRAIYILKFKSLKSGVFFLWQKSQTQEQTYKKQFVYLQMLAKIPIQDWMVGYIHCIVG